MRNRSLSTQVPRCAMCEIEHWERLKAGAGPMSAKFYNLIVQRISKRITAVSELRYLHSCDVHIDVLKKLREDTVKVSLRQLAEMKKKALQSAQELAEKELRFRNTACMPQPNVDVLYRMAREISHIKAVLGQRLRRYEEAQKMLPKQRKTSAANSIISEMTTDTNTATEISTIQKLVPTTIVDAGVAYEPKTEFILPDADIETV